MFLSSFPFASVFILSVSFHLVISSHRTFTNFPFRISHPMFVAYLFPSLSFLFAPTYLPLFSPCPLSFLQPCVLAAHPGLSRLFSIPCIFLPILLLRVFAPFYDYFHPSFFLPFPSPSSLPLSTTAGTSPDPCPSSSPSGDEIVI